MPKLADDIIRRLKERKKSLDLPYPEIASRIGVHFNTLSRAINGGSVNRNNAGKIIAFAVGDQGAAETVVEVSPFAAEKLATYAKAGRAEAGEWLSAMVYWLDIQSPQFKQFIHESVADTLQSIRMPAIAAGRRKGAAPSSGSDQTRSTGGAPANSH